MPKTLQVWVMIGLVVLILVMGVLSFPQIFTVFAPVGTNVEQRPTHLTEHVVDPPDKKDDEKIVTRKSSADAENPRSLAARSVANPLPQENLTTSNANPFPYPASHKGLQVEERDPMLEEEATVPSWEEQNAQEQYLQEVATLEERLQQEFDPTAATPNLTAEQVAAIEEEIQDSILQGESLQ